MKKKIRNRALPPSKTPKIIKKGKPNCHHFEDIVGFIGTCRKCGQVRDYAPCQMTLEEYRESLKEKSRRGQKRGAETQRKRKVANAD